LLERERKSDGRAKAAAIAQSTPIRTGNLVSVSYRLVGRTHGTPEIISQLQVMRKEPHKI
jgi:hypothetical protein